MWNKKEEISNQRLARVRDIHRLYVRKRINSVPVSSQSLI